MKYQWIAEVTNANGSQVWEVEANSPEEARDKIKSGEGDIIEEEINVNGIRFPDNKLPTQSL